MAVIIPTDFKASLMESIWHNYFDSLFYYFWIQRNHTWSLKPTRKSMEESNNSEWKIYRDSAKVRFNCEKCGHKWTSMKGRIVFSFMLNSSGFFDVYGRYFRKGVVLFKLFGQKCQKCMDKRRFEAPMWYPEEVKKVLNNIFERVGQSFYGFQGTVPRLERRNGKPMQKHNSELCQACQEGGICLK